MAVTEKVWNVITDSVQRWNEYTGENLTRENFPGCGRIAAITTPPQADMGTVPVSQGIPTVTTEIIFRNFVPDGSILCPLCGGWGHRGDGKLEITPQYTKITPGSQCGGCNGSGRVFATYRPWKRP